MKAKIISTYKKQQKRQKYGNQKTDVDGMTFDSKKEARRYQDLKLMQMAGLITGLQRQVEFELLPSQVPKYKKPLCYVADFVYAEKEIDGKWHQVIEDVKSDATRKDKVYKIKKRLLWQLHGKEIRET